MAKSAVCPGLITIIWSLITSNSTGMPDIEECSDELIEYVNNRDSAPSNYTSSGGNPLSQNASQKNSIEQEARKVKDLDQITKW